MTDPIELDLDKLQKYLQLRDSISTGDAITWVGKGIVPWVIRHWSERSHASLVIRLKKYGSLVNRIFLVEALEQGLRLNLLSERLSEYNGAAYWLPANMTQRQKLATVDFAMVACARDKGYDYEGLFRNMLGHVSLDAHRYFCSEFVADAWITVGRCKPFRPVFSVHERAPRPGDLAYWLRTEEVRLF